jgi:outer membrane protein assembly factor BamB
VTIIDLGEVTATEFEPARPPARAFRHLIRPAVLAVVTLLVLVTATASALPQPPRGLRPLWDTPLASADTTFLTEDTVYVNRLDDDLDGGTLTAYDVATGTERWTADAGDLSDYPDLATAGGVLLQPFATAEAKIAGGTVLFTSTTVALDQATGARLWKRDAGRIHVAGDMVLLDEHDATGRSTRLRMVRLRDGGTVWSRALTANGAVTASDDAVVTVDDHGGVTVLRWADGSVRSNGIVPWTPDRLLEGLSSGLDITGGVLVVSRSDQRDTTSAVYRLDTLAEVWHSGGYVSGCETVLCSPEGDDVVGRDPLTGAERWRLPHLTQVYAIGSGRLLAEAPSDDDGQLLIDAGTGRSLAALGPGQLPWSGGLDGPLLLLRSAFESPLHVTVIRIDRRTGEQFTLGALDWIGDGNPNCQAEEHYLACPGHDRLHITAVG